MVTKYTILRGGVMFNLFKKKKSDSSDDLDLPPLPPLDDLNSSNTNSNDDGLQIPNIPKIDDSIPNPYTAKTDIADMSAPEIKLPEGLELPKFNNSVQEPAIPNISDSKTTTVQSSTARKLDEPAPLDVPINNTTSETNTNGESFKTISNSITQDDSDNLTEDPFEMSAPALDIPEDATGEVFKTETTVEDISDDGSTVRSGNQYSFPELEEFDEQIIKEQHKNFDDLVSDVREQARYVDLDDYQKMLEDLTTVKALLKEKKDVYIHLNDIKNLKDEKFLKWKNNLEDIQRKLVFIDKTVFGDN